jgi:isoquinoline 1-oxidoreductase subunit beta
MPGKPLARTALVDKQTGKISVHNLWMAIDPGIVVHPDQIHARLQSGMVFGLSAALVEELTFKDRAPQATNFDSSPVLRMADMPEIHTKIVASDAAPTGIGAVAVPTVAPAVANAIGQLTGKRLRDLPVSAERVKRSLA